MLLGLTISVIGVLSTCSSFVTWSFLVVGTLSASGWLKPKLTPPSFALFFVVSALSGLLWLIGSVGLPLSNVILQLAILLKAGLAPFHFWVCKVLVPLDQVSLCIVLGPLKLVPLRLITTLSTPSLMLALPSMVLGLVLLWSSPCLNLLLYASGSLQLVLVLAAGHHLGLLYFTIYCITLSCVVLARFRMCSPTFVVLSLAGIPPYRIFSGKLLLIATLPSVFGCLVVLLSVLTVRPYIEVGLALHSKAHTLLSFAGLTVLVPALLVHSCSLL